MIDFWNLFTHSLWIVGAAIVVASWSWLDWRSAARGTGIRGTLARALWSPGMALGLALACLGAGLGVAPGWQRVAWLLLAGVLALYSGWALVRGREVRPR